MRVTRRRDQLGPLAVQSIRDRVASALPRNVVLRIQTLKARPRTRSAHRAFAAAAPGDRLSLTDLRRLQSEYAPAPAYSYESEVRSERGRERAERFPAMLSRQSVNSVLETGCSDGMVGYHLAKHGQEATGIDFRAQAFDARAIDAGVRLIQMDAEALEFEDRSFDAAISYDSFEHFASPERALSELHRVVKPGGPIYLEFGPLYL